MSEAAARAERTVLTVTQLTQRIRKRLDEMGPVHVEGEVSKPFASQNGHLYFDLKDEENVVHCVVWRNARASIPFEIKHGLEIVAFGMLGLYGPRGQYQLYVTRAEPRGAGALQLRFEQLKAKLAAEGLFDEARKRPLPFLPAAVGIVTSIDSAARHDIEDTLTKRFPRMHIVFHDVRVQGDGAAGEIAAAIHRLNLSHPEIEVLIVGRGGGSLEDLWAFNEEVVARAIAGSRIPVVSAVGHETDFTIADFVADARAKTPTEAAHLVVPDLRELETRLSQLGDRADRALQTRLLDATRRADECGRALATALRHVAESAAHRVRRVGDMLPRALRARVREEAAELRSLDASMNASMKSRLRTARDRLGRTAAAMEALSPLAVLGRGFSVTRDAAGRVVANAGSVSPGDALETILREGRIISRVESSQGTRHKAQDPT